MQTLTGDWEKHGLLVTFFLLLLWDSVLRLTFSSLVTLAERYGFDYFRVDLRVPVRSWEPCRGGVQTGHVHCCGRPVTGFLHVPLCERV